MEITRVQCDMCGQIYDDIPTGRGGVPKSSYTIIKNGVHQIINPCHKCTTRLDEFLTFADSDMFISDSNATTKTSV
jgi:hypothetical protein